MPVCKICDKSFPFMVEIEGKARNLKNRKYCLECSPFGRHNTMQLHKIPQENIQEHFQMNRQEFKYCKGCDQFLNRGEFYQYKKQKRILNRCKKCMLKDVHNRSLQFKIQCIELKGGKCIDCGYQGHPAAFDFHHRDPTKKDFNVSKFKLKSKMTDDVIRELEKCDLLCAICHRIRHFKGAK